MGWNSVSFDSATFSRSVTYFAVRKDISLYNVARNQSAAHLCSFFYVRLEIRLLTLFSNGKYISSKLGSAVSAVSNPLYLRYLGSERNPIFLFEDKTAKPFLPFDLKSFIHSSKSRFE